MRENGWNWRTLVHSSPDPQLTQRVNGHGGDALALDGQESSLGEQAQCVLNGALGESGGRNHVEEAHLHARCADAVGVAPEKQEDDERRGLAVVSDEVGQEDVDDVRVEL